MPTSRKDPRNQKRGVRRPAGPAGAGKAFPRGPSHVPAGEFKARCLALMDRVQMTGEEFVITKRGRPVAKLAPIIDEDVRPFVGRSRGVIEASREDLLAAIGADWEVDADL